MPHAIRLGVPLHPGERHVMIAHAVAIHRHRMKLDRPWNRQRVPKLGPRARSRCSAWLGGLESRDSLGFAGATAHGPKKLPGLRLRLLRRHIQPISGT